MPLTASDFENGKKHYFLVGNRMGEWRLLPEWEFQVEESTGDLVLKNRWIYPGGFAVAVVDSYEKYLVHSFTFYAPNEDYEFHDSWLECTTDFSSYGQDWVQAAGETRYDPSGHKFYTSFSESKGGGNYWQADGTLMTEIRVGLNSSGLPKSFKFTMGDKTAANQHRFFTLVGDNIYNTNYCNSEGPGVTLMKTKGQNTGNGWQEGWIQYDQKTNTPYVDGNGNYLYHTSYTPDYFQANPALFNETLSDGSNFSYTSTEAQFVESSQLKNLNSDPYKDFYTSISGSKTITTNTTEALTGNGYNYFIQTDNGDVDPADGNNWSCYVVRDMWVAGTIKIWTGWGGNDRYSGGENDVDGATWHGENGGPSVSNKQVVGFDINSGETVVLYNNDKNVEGVNYKVSDGTPVYFNRVILWYNINEGIENSFVQFIQAECGPAIFAQNAANTVDTSLNNYIKYNWYLNNTEGNSTLKVLGYSIRRYRIENGTQTFIGYPEGEYVDISSKGLTAGDLSKTYAANQSFTTVIDGGIDGTSGFAPGQYQYDIVVTFADGTKEAVSNKVFIYGNNIVTPTAVPLQLVKLDDNGKTQLGSDLGTTVTQNYLAYNPVVNGSWFVLDVDAATGAPSNGVVVDGTKALNFLTNNQDKYVWTSNFYVRCLDNELYTSTFEEYVSQGLVEAIPTPTVTVTDGTVSSTAVQFALGDNDYYSAVLMRGGNIATGNAKVTLSYSYTNANSVTVKETPTASTQLIPVLPLAYNPTYSYTSEAQTEVVSGDYVKVDVPSKNYDNVNNAFSAPNATSNVYVPVSSDGKVKTNILKLDVDYYRPNVDAEILEKYNIGHIVEVGGDQYSYTDAGDKAGANNFIVAGVSPYNDADATVKFTTTTYVNSISGAIDAYGTFGNGINFNAPHIVTPEEGTLSGVHIGKLVKDGKYDWMYKGHESFIDEDAVLANQGYSELEAEYTSNIEPYYYLYELSNGTDKATYEYLVPHAKVESESNGLVVGDVDDAAKGFINDETDPLIATYIAKGFNDETTPAVYVSSIFLYSVPEYKDVVFTAANGAAQVKAENISDITWSDMVAGGQGDLPDTGTTQAAALLGGHQAVFGVTYKAEIDNKNVTGVEDVIAEGEGGEAVYYNLQGIRVENPSAAGVYVRVQGKDVKKVVIK